MLKNDSATLEGDDRFEGFAVDLMAALSKELGFNYTFIIQEDKEYGEPSEKNRSDWNGMIGRLMRKVIENS